MTAVTNAIIVVVLAMIAMYFKVLIRKILFVCGYPDLETIHPELGAYSVGSVQIRLSKDLVPVQLFYPVEKDAKRASNKFVPYYRPQAVKGLVIFLDDMYGSGKSADGVIQFLQDAKHPNLKYYGANPIMSTPTATTKDGSKHKFPLVLFSHGLSGTIEAYSEICSQLASLGCVVVAPEHSDSSASYSSKVMEDGSIQEVWYKGPTPDSVEPYSRGKMIRYRGPHCEIRVDELTALYEFLKSGAKVSYPNNPDEDIAIANQVLETFDPLQLHLVGHSFGSCTTCLAAQRWAIQRSEEKSTVIPIPLSMTICDPWNFPLTDEISNKGIPKAKNQTSMPPILSVISEEWVTNPEVEPLKEYLRASQSNGCPVQSYYAKNSVHVSFSDTEAWFPNFMAKRGDGEEAHVTIRAVVSAFSKTTGIGSGENKNKEGSLEALVEFPFETL